MPNKKWPSVFVKVSGDICDSPEFITWLRGVSANHFVVVCVGGGTQINEAMEKAGVPRTPHGPLGRELPTFELRQLARNVLEQNRDRLQDKLKEEEISAQVIVPALDVGTVLCHVNGDEFIRIAYLGFDQLYLITTVNRVETKTKEFAFLTKVKVLGFRLPS